MSFFSDGIGAEPAAFDCYRPGSLAYPLCPLHIKLVVRFFLKRPHTNQQPLAALTDYSVHLRYVDA
jgi:hypothetical protein